jgi:SAM-dependent methyltransferase
VPDDAEAVVGKVRERYGRIAEGEGGCGCGLAGAGASVEVDLAERLGYDRQQLDAVPGGANLGLGCGAPVALLDPRPGEVVLDLGSGGGLDAFLAASRVGGTGKVIGVDMTPEMIERARASAARAGLAQVEFRQGRLEELPVDDGSVDAVTSNCVINLVPDKERVFREIFRVLRPGGRAVISDIVLDGRLPAALERDLLAYVGCVAGAMEREAYFGTVAASRLRGVEVLRDVDYLATVGEVLPEEVLALLGRTGLRVEDVRGIVRSVTFRARKPVTA